MSKRNIEKHILMNKAEAQDLQKKAKRACLSEGGLIRLLLKGYEPREKPDERFYDVMRELSAIGKSFIKSYCAVLLEGAVIVLACIIFSLFASTPPVVNPDAAAVTQVWAYIGELVFNMLVLVGAVKMSDRIIREMMGL